MAKITDMQQQAVQVPAMKAMVWGIKAEYHIRRHEQKLQKYPFDAGIDLFPDSCDPGIVPVSDSMVRINVGTSFHMLIAPGVVGLIIDRSSTPELLHGATTYGGVIDAGYTGELKVHIHVSANKVTEALADIKRCCQQELAVAQLVLVPFFRPVMGLSDGIPFVNGRGSQGYGSTNNGGQSLIS